MALVPPPSQAYRQITFRLSGGSSPVTFSFALRPEELSVEEPTRVSVTQTLGGAWLDEFGQGITTINLSGTNGWRGGLLMSGEDMFAALRSTVLTEWVAQRKEAREKGIDPDKVKLTFIDNLDNITVVVAPSRFVTHRSKQFPLLIYYQVQLIVLADATDGGSILDQIINGLSNPLRFIAGITGLGNVLTTVQSYAQGVLGAVGAAGAAVQSFMSVAQKLIGMVSGIAGASQGVFTGAAASALQFAQSFCGAGANAFAVFAASSESLPPAQLIPVLTVWAAFNDAACNMANSFNQLATYPDYSALLGASSCSSTAGGDPPSVYTTSGQNPLEAIFTPATPPLLVTQDAAAAVAALQADPLSMVGQQAAVAALMQRAAAGVTVQS